MCLPKLLKSRIRRLPGQIIFHSSLFKLGLFNLNYPSSCFYSVPVPTKARCSALADEDTDSPKGTGQNVTTTRWMPSGDASPAYEEEHFSCLCLQGTDATLEKA
jgi:hypothetical protein